VINELYNLYHKFFAHFGIFENDSKADLNLKVGVILDQNEQKLHLPVQCISKNQISNNKNLLVIMINLPSISNLMLKIKLSILNIFHMCSQFFIQWYFSFRQELLERWKQSVLVEQGHAEGL
jgi:hypothetical protein